ncbi:hypothetical protein VTJ04DRAFT_2138 [Mycothermus thermophilus]|uniref:uncharacterized protein n=1 Tax=Humicola insolens TaxID=85995 RepID=UPI0037444E4A
MKFQLIAASTALLIASVAALPAPTAETEVNNLAIDARDVQVVDGLVARADAAPEQVDGLLARDDDDDDLELDLDEDMDIALEALFAQIMDIPDEILEQGDEALNKWLIENGYREPGEQKRDVEEADDDAAEGSLDFFDAGLEGSEEEADGGLVARGQLEARRNKLKCALAVAKMIATNVVPAAKLLRIKKYIKAIGGVTKAVKLIFKGKNKAQWIKAGGQTLYKLVQEIIGITEIKKHCF